MSRILVTDDDNDFRATLCDSLERMGHTVLQAANGREALSLLDVEPVDVLILDIIMPEKEGLETILELRKKFKDLKVLAISGGGRIDAFDHLKSAKLMGASATLHKPFAQKKLAAILSELGIE